MQNSKLIVLLYCTKIYIYTALAQNLTKFKMLLDERKERRYLKNLNLKNRVYRLANAYVYTIFDMPCFELLITSIADKDACSTGTAGLSLPAQRGQRSKMHPFCQSNSLSQQIFINGVQKSYISYACP